MPPPSDLAEPTQRKVRVVISSADRNLTTYPSPADYVVNLDEPLADVVSIALLTATVPLVAYQISTANNKVPFSITRNGITTVHVADIPPGDYEPPTLLAAAVKDAMDRACNSQVTFEVTYVQTKDAFLFTCADAPFELQFYGGTVPFGPQIQDEFGNLTSQGIIETLAIAGDRSKSYASHSAARVLGFGPERYVSVFTSNQVHQIASAFRRDASSYKDTAVMYLSGADVNVCADNTFHRSFAIMGPKQVHMNHWVPDRAIVKGYSPPIGKVARFTIRFRDIYGNPYDFQNHDHRLEFMVSCTPRYQSRPNWTTRAD